MANTPLFVSDDVSERYGIWGTETVFPTDPHIRDRPAGMEWVAIQFDRTQPERWVALSYHKTEEQAARACTRYAPQVLRVRPTASELADEVVRVGGLDAHVTVSVTQNLATVRVDGWREGVPCRAVGTMDALRRLPDDAGADAVRAALVSLR